MINDIAFLLVTCCLEPSRTEILKQVITSLNEQAPLQLNKISVFDNGSTESGVIELLEQNFTNVYRTPKNVGYWSAINWWLQQQKKNNPTFTYIIESDMIHYDFEALNVCAELLKRNDDIGSVRLHEFSFDKRHYYNKDNPIHGSKKNIWQSFTNNVTHKKIVFSEPIRFSGKNFYTTNFLTQLPALNRFDDVAEIFDDLAKLKNFTERDFQAKYYERYDKTAILDGGIFHCDAGGFDNKDKTITGSWSSEEDLKRVGYQNTRFASIQSGFDIIRY